MQVWLASVFAQAQQHLVSLREGLKKTANYPHFVDKKGGSSNVDKRFEGVGEGGERGGWSPHVHKKIPYCEYY